MRTVGARKISRSTRIHSQRVRYQRRPPADQRGHGVVTFFVRSSAATVPVHACVSHTVWDRTRPHINTSRMFSRKSPLPISTFVYNYAPYQHPIVDGMLATLPRSVSSWPRVCCYPIPIADHRHNFREARRRR